MQELIKKKPVLIVVSIAVLLLIFIVIKSCGKKSQGKYKYKEVTIGKVQKTVSATGVLNLENISTVTSKIAGIVSKVYVENEAGVKKGQLLATIDTTELNNSVSKLSAQLETMQMELQVAKEDLESKRSMFKEELISQKGFERAEFTYKSVYLKYKQVLLDYKILKGQQRNARIYSPITGKVLEVLIKDNDALVPHRPCFLVVPSFKNMSITVNIDESDIGLIKKGQEVNFSVSAYTDTTFDGKITEVSLTPKAKGAIVTYPATIECENKDLLLKPGMTATVIITVKKKDNVLRIENQAFNVSLKGFQTETNKKFVWKKINGTKNGLPVEKVYVETGIQGDVFTEILKNLKKGDKILTQYLKGKK